MKNCLFPEPLGLALLPVLVPVEAVRTVAVAAAATEAPDFFDVERAFPCFDGPTSLYKGSVKRGAGARSVGPFKSFDY